MALISVGVDHEHASLELLERVNIPEQEWAKVLRVLASHRNIHEAVFVSTCLRTEVIAVIDRFHGAVDEITATLADVTQVDPAIFRDHLSIHFDRGVATHLFSVAAGLKSVVLGEFEVLGQLRRASDLATDEQVAGPVLGELFQRALASGRRVRHETAVARGTTSFAHAAVEVTIEELGSQAAGAGIVVVGAGQLATGVVKSLLAASVGIGPVTVVNRTAQRAQDLVATVGDKRLAVHPFDDLATVVRTARATIVAAQVPAPVITPASLGRGPQLFVDLAVPHGVAREVARHPDVRRVDIDTLQSRVALALEDRRVAVDEATAIVTQDVEKYLDDQRSRGAAVIVSELRAYFDAVLAGEFERRAHELDALSPEQRETVASLARAIVAKLAHRPTTALKETAGTDKGLRLSEAVRTLFDL